MNPGAVTLSLKLTTGLGSYSYLCFFFFRKSGSTVTSLPYLNYSESGNISKMNFMLLLLIGYGI